MKPIRLYARIACLVMIAGAFSCKNEHVPQNTAAYVTDAQIPVSWYELELKLLRESKGINRPEAAKAIAYTGMALNEAATGQQYVPAIAANSAMAYIIRGMFKNASAEHQNLITQLENRNLQAYAGSYSQEEILRSVNFGRKVAIAVYRWSTTDGG